MPRAGFDREGGGSGGPDRADRARAFRVHARRPARLRVLAHHAGAGWQGQVTVENIGLGGARLLFDERIALGDSVTLSFTAPTLWDPLVFLARVAWVDPTAAPSAPDHAPAQPGTGRHRAGVTFEHHEAHAVFALYELIAALGYE